jgi:hypothetical protein
VKVRYHSYHGGGSHDAAPSFEGAQTVTVHTGVCANADCDAGKPLLVAGVRGTEKRDHDTVESEAGCVRCGKTIGRLVVKFDTTFGLEEDERVLRGRPRVY